MTRPARFNADALEPARRAQRSALRADRIYREEVLRAYFGGNSCRSIGQSLGWSESAIQSLVGEMKLWAEREQSYLDAPFLGTNANDHDRHEREHRRRADRLDQIMWRHDYAPVPENGALVA